ncbi:hypothetical protein [uncultured Sphingomonas sp.]|uniref:hypothetical protein n=1 Tax=uncultured Sphingomonas sp. TaxID=158754 RepID=UPI0025D35D16|nr:hypothetical protein [uncultured Sphingomonas sp.]
MLGWRKHGRRIAALEGEVETLRDLYLSACAASTEAAQQQQADLARLVEQVEAGRGDLAALRQQHDAALDGLVRHSDENGRLQNRLDDLEAQARRHEQGTTDLASDLRRLEQRQSLHETDAIALYQAVVTRIEDKTNRRHQYSVQQEI